MMNKPSTLSTGSVVNSPAHCRSETMLNYAKRISVFIVAAAGLYAQTAAPNTPVTDTRASGAVGIAQGQTARFNVLRPDATATAACSAVLTYFNGAGKQLK